MTTIERLRALHGAVYRRLVSVHRFRDKGGEATASLIVEVVNALPALLDVAEAARAFMEDEIGWYGSNAYLIFSSVDGPPIRALRAALDRLDGAS